MVAGTRFALLLLVPAGFTLARTGDMPKQQSNAAAGTTWLGWTPDMSAAVGILGAIFKSRCRGSAVVASDFTWQKVVDKSKPTIHWNDIKFIGHDIGYVVWAVRRGTAHTT